jgi:EAL domain-containing protein (putative c-di-GMP-specific phosphodiesterase class I)
VCLSLDDFGTGYSSLSQLAHYPFDHLKIDRSFVRDLPAGPPPHDRVGAHAQWMIQAIASLGRGLGMETIAEGVEQEWQADLVRQAGVTDLQGYLFGRPTPPAELPDLVARLRAAAVAHRAAPAPSEPPKE